MKLKKTLSGLLAVIMTISVFAGCSKKENNRSKDDPIELTWYYSGVKQDSTYDAVWEKANELLAERYGLKLDFVMTDGSNYSQKIQMMNAAQESYDIAFTSNWTNNYHTNVANGSLYDITELLPEKAPKLWASLADYEREAVTVDGKIYAVPNWQVQARAMGVSIPKQMIDLTSYTIDDINNVEDFEAYITELVSKKPEYAHARNTKWRIMSVDYGLTFVGQESLPVGVYYAKDGKPEIVNVYATPEFKEFAELARRWTEKGLRPNVKTTKDYTKKDDLRVPGSFENLKPEYLYSDVKSTGYEVVNKILSPAVAATETFLSTLKGVGAYSKHPEEAVEMFEIMHTDKEIYNMLSFGLEGVNYDKIGDNRIEIREDSTYTMANWALGSIANSYITGVLPDDIWEQTKKFNDEAIKPTINGFQLNTDVITTELGNCETVVQKHLENIELGLEDIDATLPAFLNELEEAGVNDLIAKVQAQVDEWWATK